MINDVDLIYRELLFVKYCLQCICILLSMLSCGLYVVDLIYSILLFTASSQIINYLYNLNKY